MKNLPRYSYSIIVYAFASCSSSPYEVSLLVDIPIAEDKIVSIHNLSNGVHVYHDTLRGKVVLDPPSHGIHLLTVMWDRDVLSPEEFRSLRPHTLDNPSYYYLQKHMSTYFPRKFLFFFIILTIGFNFKYKHKN